MPPRELQPRYEPEPPPPKSWYNDSYIFAMTRGVADSTLVPAAKAPLYLLTVPLDLRSGDPTGPPRTSPSTST